MAQPEITVDQITAAPTFDGTNITNVDAVALNGVADTGYAKLATSNTFSILQKIVASINPVLQIGPTSDAWSGTVGILIINAGGIAQWGIGHTPSVGDFYIARGAGAANKVFSATSTAGELAVTATDVTFEGASVINTTVLTLTNNRVIQLSDARKYLRMNSGSSRTFTVSTGLSSLPTGTHIDLHQAGVGAVTVVASGVVINAPESLILRKRHSTATLIKVGLNEWDLVGDMRFL